MQRKHLEFPAQRQEAPNTCLPACLSIALRFLGVARGESELAALYGTRSFGTTVLGAMRALDELGCDALPFQGAGLDELAGYIKVARPTVLFLTASRAGRGIYGSHAVLAVEVA